MDLSATDTDDANGYTIAKERHGKIRSGSAQPGQSRRDRELGFCGRDVVNVNGFQIDHCAARDVATIENWPGPHGWYIPVGGHEMQLAVFESVHDRIRGTTDTGCILGHDVHQRLQVGRKARDSPQDLARRGLLLVSVN